MMRRVIRLLTASVVLAALVGAAGAADTGLDPPLGVQKTGVRGTKTAPAGTLTCHRFAHVVIKVVDRGEVGADRIAIVPLRAGAAPPPCRLGAAPGEIVIDPKDWSGYFKGVKGDFVLLDASDGADGALGFAVFAAASGRKLFEDAADGDLQSAAATGDALRLRYRRSVTGPCSIVAAGTACWQRIAQQLGLDAAKPPDCASGYRAAKQALAEARCEGKAAKPACIDAAIKEADAQKFDEANSVIGFDAESVITAAHAVTTVRSAALSCRPAD